MKKRILLVTDASFLPTGYGNMAAQWLKRLHESGKYELAELGCFGAVDDPRQLSCPWKFYQNFPTNKEEEELYKNEIFSLGKLKFEQVCLDFKPDIVWSFRDGWVDEFIASSPYRKFFRWAFMPAVDSPRQKDDWISVYGDADALVGYTQWGIDVMHSYLGKEGKGTFITPGVELDVFRPYPEKESLKRLVGLPEGALVVGTVMRNQKRKLFLDLIDSFKAVMEKAPKAISDKMFLYLHTGYPDISGWEIPGHIADLDLGNRVMLTYICSLCKSCYPDFYKGPHFYCKTCGNRSSALSGPNRGVERNALAKIYNMMDLYVQPAVCFLPGTEILTGDGWNPIESISKQDNVWTHNGNFKPVLELMERDYVGEIVTIGNNCSSEVVSMTPEHPVYAISNHSFGKKNLEQFVREVNSRKENYQLNPEFIDAGKLAFGDYIATKVDYSCEDLEKLDLSDYVSRYDLVEENEITISKGSRYNRYVEVDEDFCRFLGLFVADGSSASHSGTFSVTMHCDETINKELCQRVMTKISGKTPTILFYKDRKAITLLSYCTPMCGLLKDMCSKGLDKKLPDWAPRLPISKMSAVLQGLFIGDGCYYKPRDITVYNTISKSIYGQIVFMLRKLNVAYSVCKMEKEGNRHDQYQFEVGGNVKELKIRADKRSSNFYYEGYFFSRINKILKSEYSGKVYNIEVKDDNSYTTRIGAVHNCEGLGMPQIEAAASGVYFMATDFSAMSEVCETLDGQKIKLRSEYYENETNRVLSLPDNNDLVEKMLAFLKLPEMVRGRMGLNCARKVRENYDYDYTVKKWMKIFDEMPSPEKPWDSPKINKVQNLSVPTEVGHADFVDWCLTNIACRPDMIRSNVRDSMIRNLNYGFFKAMGMGTPHPYDRHQVTRHCQRIYEIDMQYENMRTAK